MKLCTSCAGTEADGATFGPTKHGVPRLCLDCSKPSEPIRSYETFEELRRYFALHEHRGRASITARTRASYRAALRHRQKQAQMDWVDQMGPTP